MSHIAKELTTLIQEKNITAAELSRESGITEAQISRLKSGVQKTLKPRTISQLAKGLCPIDKSERFTATRAELLYAYLRDTCSGPGSNLIEITLHNSAPASKNNADDETKLILPPRIQENLDLITRQISDNRIVRDLIESVANVCRATSSPAQSKEMPTLN